MRPAIKCSSILLTLGILLISTACNNTQKQKDTVSVNKLTDNYAVEVAMENQVFRIQQKELLPVKTRVTKDSILLLFRADKNPFQLNLNLIHTDILSKQKTTYSIPEANASKTKVDLNFFNRDRDVSRINKRIVFKKGTVEIKKLTRNKLEMTFKGEGSGITERGGNFPISGKINVTLTP